MLDAAGCRRARLARSAARRSAARRCARLGQLLREHKDALGTPRSPRERQDHGRGRRRSAGDDRHLPTSPSGCRAMLYGLTMHSERPAHRMYEQWHPLGVVGVITAFNFPVAVWAWNAMLAAVCGDAVVWKPSPKTPLRAIARARSIANRVVEALGVPPIFTLLHRRASERRRSARRRIRASPLVSFTGSSRRRHARSRGASRRAFGTVPARAAAATTRSSSPRTPISIWSCPRCCSAPSARRASAARRRAGCSCTSRIAAERRARGSRARMRRCRIGDPLDAGDADGAADRRARRSTATAAQSAKRVPRAARVCARRHARSTARLLRRADDHRRRRRNDGRSCSARPSRRSSTSSRSTTLDRGAIAMHNARAAGVCRRRSSRADVRTAEAFLVGGGQRLRHRQRQPGQRRAPRSGARSAARRKPAADARRGRDAWQAYMRRQTNTIN